MSYQKAVEELVHEEAKDTDDGVAQMVDKQHVHDDRFVATGERSLVAHKAHEKDDLVKQLQKKETRLT